MRNGVRMVAMSKTIKITLALSLLINLVGAVGLGLIVRRNGGIDYLGEKMGLIRTVFRPQEFQMKTIDKYRMMPNTRDEIVFAGDSIVHSIPWADYYSVIRNRGMSGDTTDGLRQRLDEILESKPRAIFFGVGTNDLARMIEVDEVVGNYRAILDRVARESPKTSVVVIGVLPTNLDMRANAAARKKFGNIPLLNLAVSKMVESYPNVEFVDVAPELTDENGYLRSEFTTDGLHLNPQGKAVYLRQLTPHVARVHPNMPVRLETR